MGSLCGGVDFVCVCLDGRLHSADSDDPGYGNEFGAYDYFIRGGSYGHQFRRRQHAELGDERGYQRGHYAGGVYFDVG